MFSVKSRHFEKYQILNLSDEFLAQKMGYKIIYDNPTLTSITHLLYVIPVRQTLSQAGEIIGYYFVNN